MKLSSRLTALTFIAVLGLAAHADAGGACQTGGPAGAHNQSAYNAGYYDGLCGDYLWFGYGYNYNSYCSTAAYYATSQGIGTAGTGVCANGNSYNHYAGAYHGECRYWEMSGFGFDYDGYCTIANEWASAGACTGCQY